jgi:hypothetical protein
MVAQAQQQGLALALRITPRSRFLIHPNLDTLLKVFYSA